jgi:peptidoglycan/xylan/chitin deacetylase (PgdA/CDA1 family)
LGFGVSAGYALARLARFATRPLRHSRGTRPHHPEFPHEPHHQTPNPKPLIPPLRTAFYLATSGAIVAGGASLYGHGLSRPVTGALLAGYLAFVALGVTRPGTQIFGDVVTRVPDGFALTFEGGPHPEHTRRVMDALEARGAKGTFFLLGARMEQHPDVVRELRARGHALGALGFAPDRFHLLRTGGWLENDADREERIWETLVGAPPVLYRPPAGLMTPRLARLADDRERTLVGWSVDARDGRAGEDPARVAARVARQLRRGTIVRLRDALPSEATPPAVAALPAILDAAARLGVSARTVPVP